MLHSYLTKILATARLGDAREESYYSVLDGLLLGYAQSNGKKDAHVTTLPKKTEAGNPDFRIWDGKRKIVGYVEAKMPDSNLDVIEKTEQINRYRETFTNFILTNFFEFRLCAFLLLPLNLRLNRAGLSFSCLSHAESSTELGFAVFSRYWKRMDVQRFEAP